MEILTKLNLSSGEVNASNITQTQIIIYLLTAWPSILYFISAAPRLYFPETLFQHICSIANCANTEHRLVLVVSCEPCRQHGQCLFNFCVRTGKNKLMFRSFVWIRPVEIFILNFSRYRVLLARAQWRNGRVSGCPVTGAPRTLGTPDKNDHKKFDSTFLGNWITKNRQIGSYLLWSCLLMSLCYNFAKNK
jgi:hypothetical protein